MAPSFGAPAHNEQRFFPLASSKSHTSTKKAGTFWLEKERKADFSFIWSRGCESDLVCALKA